MSLPLWVQYFQALTPTIVALLVAFIAWRQWVTSKQTLKSDIFDRRFSAYLKLRAIHSEATQRKRLPPGINDINESLAEAYFLFPADVYKKWEEVHLNAMKIIDGRSRNSDAAETSFETLRKSLHPYMSLHYKA